jgi:radical SAM protein with 4Fe4S-binding SPASM domain
MEDNQFVPETCVWELTLRCNMRCIHCGSAAGIARSNELTIDECMPVVDDLIKLGCRNLTLIGGEVFLYKGWEKIARKFTDGGVEVNIITNALLMGDKQIEEIRYAGLLNVGVSLDGMEENHDRIRNVKGSFKKTCRAIERLNKEEIPVAVVTSLMDFNYYDLEDIHNMLCSYEANVWQIQLVTAMGNMSCSKDLLIKPDKIPSITKFIREKRKDGLIRIFAADDIGYFDENEMYIRNKPGTICVWAGCQAGLTVVGIDSVGNVKGCESIYSEDLIEGNLREESFETIWYKEGNFAYNRNFDIQQLSGKCGACDKAMYCRGGCRGSNFFTKGTFFENAYCCYPGAQKIA